MFPRPKRDSSETSVVPPPENDTSENSKTENDKTEKKWTLMFYFASDNSLASAIVSQLKALKSAGFHKEVNVIARYDPHDGTTLTHVFDVNVGEKILSNKEHHIGFNAASPFVRPMVADKLWSNETDANGNSIRQGIVDRFAELDRLRSGEPKYVYNPPQPPAETAAPSEPADPSDRLSFTIKGRTKRAKKEPSPVKSLHAFLDFCAQKYRAQRYMLFILGHGIVVGNDLFLYDANTDGDHAVTLEDLGKELNTFTANVGTKLDLVSFHSCSMSGLEVAYELKDSANYMLASEGPAFVGSWPYRQILLRIFNDVKKDGDNVNVREMLKDIFYYTLYNSYDFQLAGYSFDLCLTDLNEVGNQTETGVKYALEDLSKALIAALADGRAVDRKTDPKAAALADLTHDLIVLSHWQAQSFYEENFTDLGDFCFCLKRRCEDAAQLLSNQLPASIDKMRKACEDVLRVLGCDKPENTDRRYTRDTNPAKPGTPEVVVKSGFAGPAYQYSHGLSIYFPWSRPVDNEMWDRHYDKYQLSAGTRGCWKAFLEAYFNTTRRDTQGKEREDAKLEPQKLNADAQLLEVIGGLIFNEAGQLKSSPYDKTGEDCVCASLKNYPRITVERDTQTETNEKVKANTQTETNEKGDSVTRDVAEDFWFYQGDPQLFEGDQ
jgi:hypothetical protein